MNENDIIRYLNLGMTNEKIIKIILLNDENSDNGRRNDIYIFLAEQIYNRTVNGEFYNFRFKNSSIDSKQLQQYFDILECYLLILQRCNHSSVVECCDKLITWWHDDKCVSLSIEYDPIYKKLGKYNIIISPRLLSFCYIL
jgi:hypothetical protein